MEVGLAVGAALVMVIYVAQVFAPRIRGLTGKRKDPEQRAAELLEEYRKQQSPRKKH